jgi:branched-chain amino acid transport system permease protein
MMIAVWANQLLQGVMLGGLYTLFAIGLSLSAGVMRFVNIAHGDFIVLTCYALLLLGTLLGVNPVVATLIVLPIAFLFGFVLQRFLLQRVVGENVLLVILVTFALSIIIENGLLEGFGADPQKISGGWMETATVALGDGINVGLFQIVTFVSAVALVAVLDLLLYRTGIGAKIRAVSDDVAAANVMGGLGSLWGSLAGGIVLGLAQAIGGQFDIAWQIMAGHIVFLVVLALRPQGLFPKY